MRRGLAFDTNLLSRPLTRRPMLLWMELSGLSTVVLPTVARELTYKRDAPTQQQRLQDDHRARTWHDTWSAPDSPYELLPLTEEQNDVKAEVLQAFTLRCFPQTTVRERIERLPDARILAEAVATGVDMLVTNNMRSIDHTEVNVLVRALTGTNENIISVADDAMVLAHAGGEGSRQLLTLFLAATWPDKGESPLTMVDCHKHLVGVAQKLGTGAGMPNCAAKLENAFEVDESLEAVMVRAQELACGSVALSVDNAHADALRRGASAIRTGG